MRERAAALGGALEIGRAPAGGVRIEARLPAGATA
jgi:signal transduction histidine kinase